MIIRRLHIWFCGASQMHTDPEPRFVDPDNELVERGKLVASRTKQRKSKRSGAASLARRIRPAPRRATRTPTPSTHSVSGTG